MVVISKQLFDANISNKANCLCILHPWTNSCFGASIRTTFHVVPGIMKFYIPIYLIKLIYERRAVTRKSLEKYAKAFARSMLYASGMIFCACNTFCLQDKVESRKNYYTMIAFPGFMAGLGLLIENAENQYINTMIFATMTMESLIRNLHFFKYVNFSTFKETSIFMCSSSLLMFALANYGKDNGSVPPSLWFYKPPFCPKDKAFGNCNHGKSNADVSCQKYIFNGFSNFFLGGLLLSCLKNFIKLKFQIGEKNVKFGLVVSFFVGLYRLISCALFKLDRHSCRYHPLLAGLLAGSVYAIKPTKSFLAISITTILQILVRKYLKISDQYKFILQQLLFMTTCGIGSHNYIMIPETCPKYFANMGATVSRGTLRDICGRIHALC